MGTALSAHLRVAPTRSSRSVIPAVVLSLVVSACGAPTSITPASPSATAPATIDVAAAIATATPTAAASLTAAPKPVPTTAPAATPDPTLVADVRSDADVNRLFVGMTPDELKVLAKETGDPTYRFPLPFDPHGVRFQLRTQTVQFGANGTPFQIFGVVLLSGGVTLKLHGPGTYAMRQEVLWESAGSRYLVVPTDQDADPRQGTSFRIGTRGVFVEATPKAEIIRPIKFAEVGAPPTQFSIGLGTAILQVNSGMAPLGGPLSGVWPRSHVLIHGAGINGYPDGAPITEKSLLRASDGRIVYIRCEFRFDGSNWVQSCPGG